MKINPKYQNKYMIYVENLLNMKNLFKIQKT